MYTLPKNEYRISLTSGCNMKCVYCHNEGNTKYQELSLNDIELLIMNSYGLGLKKVRLTGGEPLIHPQIEEICKMLSEKYNLRIGINTNGILIDKMMKLINSGYIDRVIVGIDYFDHQVSKNSPIGVPSKQILENVLMIKNSGVRVDISKVYVDDYENLYNLVKWCIENEIRIKVLEKVEKYEELSISSSYLTMIDKLVEDFHLDLDFDLEYNEYFANKNGVNVISFFHSHCKLRECDLCKKMHLRVGADGMLRTCIHYDDDSIDFRQGNVRDNIIRSLTKKVDYH